MEDLKAQILKNITPKAVLIPLTKQAAQAMNQCQNGVISICRFPFKVGRESRLGQSDRGLFVKLRIRKENEKPNNDVYLVDDAKTRQIDLEHFQINRTNNFYLLRDRGSKTGTTINDITYGLSQDDEEQVLNDGDIIKIGSMDSEYKYQFLVLKDEQ